MKEALLNIAIEVGRTPAVVGIFIVGFATKYRREFINLLSLVLFSLLWIAFWKKLIGKPLPLELKSSEGYALPSGHMHQVALIGAYIAYKFRTNISLVLFSALCVAAEGWALVGKGYHDFVDVLWGVLFAWGLLFAFLFSAQRFQFEDKRCKVALWGALGATLCYPMIQQNAFQTYVLVGCWVWFFIQVGIGKFCDRKCKASCAPK